MFARGPLYEDRRQAGDALAERLEDERDAHTLVLGIPRGGVPVAARVAEVLGGDLDVILTKKIGAPGNPELAAAAVGETGELYRNELSR